jgi:hypothetical protein
VVVVVEAAKAKKYADTAIKARHKYEKRAKKARR